jgi:signal transduction histidine kinase
VIFGTLFPLVGWIVALSQTTASGVAAVHRDQPVLYIVDLAPLVLGLTGYVIGHFHARLVRMRLTVEETVQIRTAELSRALEDLSATQAEKDRFVAGVSHELRTPLTSVVGLARTLVEPGQNTSSDEQAELLHLIVRESEEVAAIVEDLLVAARIDRDQLSISSEPLWLDEELCQVVEVCKVELQPLHVEPVQVLGDPIRIHQIIRNLVTNADRYGGDIVTVEVRRDGDDAVLRVCDNGPGVPDDKVDLIFTAFGKAHHDPGRTESVGLGLTVSQNLAQLMGGDVIYRRNNDWTCFELRLPIAPSDAAERASDVVATPSQSEPCAQETPDYAATH